MAKVQKVYTREFKEQAVQLAQTSGKPITQVERRAGYLRYLDPSMAKRISSTWHRRVSRQWTSNTARRRKSSPQTRTGACATGAWYLKKILI